MTAAPPLLAPLSAVQVGPLTFGSRHIPLLAGPCSVETPTQMALAAKAARAAGAAFLRGGAFKPRTRPEAFQGLGVEGLDLLVTAARAEHLPVVTELTDIRHLDAFLAHGVDLIQVGSRNMANYDLLKELGRIDTPILLKRGLAATLQEWTGAAEYVLRGGNTRVILCERGVRSFEPAYRNMLDVTAIGVMKESTGLPVVVDPSHAGGRAALVPALARAAIAAGADGLLVEMHPFPEQAWCDADQALTPAGLESLMASLRPIARALGRDL